MLCRRVNKEMNGEAARLSPATALALDSFPTVVTWQLSFLLLSFLSCLSLKYILEREWLSNETGQARHQPPAPILAREVESVRFSQLMLPAGPICLFFEMSIMNLKCYPRPPLFLKITKHSFIKKFSLTKVRDGTTLIF